MTDHQHTADTLNRAADLIEERGWAQGNCGMALTGPTCLEGAIATVLGTEVGVYAHRKITPNDLEKGQHFYIYSRELEESAAYQAVCAHLERRASHLFSWNDAGNRTAAEVIETLRAAAVIEQARADEHTATDTGYDTAAEMLLLGAAGAAIAGGRA